MSRAGTRSRGASLAEAAVAGMLFGAGDALRTATATSLDASGAAWLALVATGAGAGVGLLVGLLLAPMPGLAAPITAGLLVGMVGATQLERRVAARGLDAGLALEAVARSVAALLVALLVLRLLRGRRMTPRVAGGIATGAALLAGSAAFALHQEATRLKDLAKVTALFRAGSLPAPATAEAHRGVMLVVIDTLRADAVGAYGQPRPVSPHLDRLSRRSALFPETYAHASWTKPSTASLLTSLPPELHGARSEPARLAPEVTTLAETLQAQGYAAVGFSANGVVSPTFGFEQGFHELHGIASTSLRAQALGRLAFGRYAGVALGLPAYLPAAYGATADMVTRAARARIAAGLPPRSFLYLHYMDPHHPYFLDGERALARRVTVTPRARDAAARAYLDELRLVDHELALLRAAARGGPHQEALIVVTADHGEELYEHGGRGHGYTLFDEQLRIPLLVHGPGVEAALMPAIARGIDVAPTILGRLGLAPPGAFRGRDLLASGEEAGERPVAHVEDFGGRRLRAVRVDGMKLIEDTGGSGRRQLYDTGADPGERHDLAGELPDRAAALQELLPAAGPEHADPLDPEAREALEALGYLN